MCFYLVKLNKEITYFFVFHIEQRNNKSFNLNYCSCFLSLESVFYFKLHKTLSNYKTHCFRPIL